MLKSFKILVFFALFLSVAKSLTPFDSEKINFAPEPKKTYSYGSESNEDTIVLNFICEDEKMIIGDNGVFHFKTSFNDISQFNLSTLEKDSLTRIRVIDNKDGRDYNATCRLWISSDNRISLFCNLNGLNFEAGVHNITISKGNFEHNNMQFNKLFFHKVKS